MSCKREAVHICIVHLLRNSMSFASWKDRKPIAQALRAVYRAETPEAGLAALEVFELRIPTEAGRVFRREAGHPFRR